MPSEPTFNSNDTSKSLLERVQRNLPDAWTTFVQLYSGYVRGMLIRYNIRADDLDDLSQEVLVTVARRIGQFQPRHHRGALRGWLKSIVHSKATDHYRRTQRQPQAGGGTDFLKSMAEVPALDMEDGSDTREQEAERDLYQKAMELVSAECEPRTWTMFKRAVIDQADTDEIAQEMGVSTAAVRVAKSRVLRKLRELLGEPPADV